MRIDNSTSSIDSAAKPEAAKRTNSANNPTTVSNNPAADSVTLSDRAKKLSEPQGVEASRQEKVDALKRAVEGGSYRVEPNKVANAMMKELNNGNKD